MNIIINLRQNFYNWVDAHPRLKQWLWFVVLWCAGLASVLVMAYPIKWVIKSMG